MHAFERGESLANSARHDQCDSSDVVKQHEISKQLSFHFDGDRLGLAPVSLAPFNLLRNAGFDHRLTRPLVRSCFAEYAGL